MENFVLYDEIGKANEQTIYKARRKGTIKYLAISCAERHKRPLISNHVRFVHVLKHSSILQFYEWYETSNHLWLVMELCTGGSLEQVVKEDVHLPENVVRKFASDIVRGLEYIHSRRVLFNEMKPSRFLLDGNGNVKLFDFSLAHLEHENLDEVLTKFNDEDELSQNYNGNETEASVFCPPELINSNSTSLSSDYWGLGCLIYYMFSGNLPFGDYSYQISEGCVHVDFVPPNVPGKKISPSLLSLLQRLLVESPEERIPPSQLLKHEFWQNCLNDLDTSSSTTDPILTDGNTTLSSQEKHSLKLANGSMKPDTEDTEVLREIPESSSLDDPAQLTEEQPEPVDQPGDLSLHLLTTSTLLGVPQGESASFLLHANSNISTISPVAVLDGDSSGNRSSESSGVNSMEDTVKNRLSRSEYNLTNRRDSHATEHAETSITSAIADKTNERPMDLKLTQLDLEIRADLACTYPWGDDYANQPQEPKLLTSMWTYLRNNSQSANVQQLKPPQPIGWRPRPLNDYNRWMRAAPPSRVEGLSFVYTEAKLRSASKEQMEHHIAEVFSLFQKQPSGAVEAGSHRLWRPAARSAKPNASSALLAYMTWLIASCTKNLGRLSFTANYRQAQTVNHSMLSDLMAELTHQLKTAVSQSGEARTSLCQLCSLLAYRTLMYMLQEPQSNLSGELNDPAFNAFVASMPQCIGSLTEILREPAARTGPRLRIAATAALGEVLSCLVWFISAAVDSTHGLKNKNTTGFDHSPGLWQNAVHHLLRCLSTSDESAGTAHPRNQDIQPKATGLTTKTESLYTGEGATGNRLTESHVRLGAARALDVFISSIIGCQLHDLPVTGAFESVVNSCITSVANPEVVIRIYTDGLMDSPNLRPGVSPAQRNQLIQDTSLACSSALAGVVRISPSLFTSGLIDRIGAPAFISFLEPPSGGIAGQQTTMTVRLLSVAAMGLLVPLADPSNRTPQLIDRRASGSTSPNPIRRPSNTAGRGTGTSAACRRLLADQRFLAAVLRHLKSPHAMIRSKAYLICSAILTTCTKESFPIAFDAQLPAYLERDLKATSTLQHRRISQCPVSPQPVQQEWDASTAYLGATTLYFANLLVSNLIPLICQQVLTALGFPGTSSVSGRQLSRATSVTPTNRTGATSSAPNMIAARVWLPAFNCLPDMLSACATVRSLLLLRDSDETPGMGSEQRPDFCFLTFLSQLFDIWASADPINSTAVVAGVHQAGSVENQFLAVALTITEILSQQSELVESRRRDFVCLIIPVLARLAVAPRARAETRSICVQIIARLAEILLNEGGNSDSTHSLADLDRPLSHVSESSADERPMSADVDLLLNELRAADAQDPLQPASTASTSSRPSMAQSCYGYISDNRPKSTKATGRSTRVTKYLLPGSIGSAVQAPTPEMLDSLFQIVNQLMIPYVK